ncbi:MAG TPA: sulfate ABC transporter substrate-binding protein [Polyangia bacterium]|nr:sulfate ABC transporter substrate-binding protein [Polyangia bacterium]
MGAKQISGNLFPLFLWVPAVALTGIATGCGEKPAADEARGEAMAPPVTILNVSYDPTRELYREFNSAFAVHWQEQTGQAVTVEQSHGGSGSQSRAVINGLEADVVTLALAYDIDAIAEHAKLLPADWQGRLPHNNAPYTSTLEFLVRKGNPKNIRDWDDLARPGVQVITPNPKTSGVARWNYLAMWGFALERELGKDFAAALKDPARAEAVAAAQQKAQAFVAAIYANVPVLDSGARAATNTFIQRRIGDVLINWENEILLGARDLDAAGLEIVIPPMSILAEPVVSIVDRNVDRKGTREVAQAYLEFLYSETGQELAAKNYYRPTASAAAREKYKDRFPEILLFGINEVFGGWSRASRDHFADGGTFDRIYQPK